MIRKVTLVSYINTFPYLEVLKNEGKFNLDLRIPSRCSDAFEDYSSDIALVPVGSLLHIKRPYRRIDQYGIGGDSEVRTVKLLSNMRKEEIQKVSLDLQSSTSVQLIRILAKNFWKLNWKFDAYDHGDVLPEAVLAIGDKVFEMETNYRYSYDLSAEWKQFTGLPFAFAVWIVSSELSKDEEDDFVDILSQTPDVLNTVINKYQSKYPDYDLDEYLKKNIQYVLHPQYKEAIELFTKYQKELVLNV